LVWESSQPLPAVRRISLTFLGLLLHPVASIRQLGAAPRSFGHRHLLLLAWLVLLSAGMATLATGMGMLAYQVQIRQSTRTDSTPLPELWLAFELEWLDRLTWTAIHGGVVLTVAAILWMVNRQHDANREIAVLAALLALAGTAGLMAPAPEASLPVVLAAAATVGLVIYHFDRIPWSNLLPLAARGLIYVAALYCFVHLAITAAEYLVSVTNDWWLQSAWLRNNARRGQSLAATGVLAVLMYTFLRSVYRTGRLRAAGTVGVYVVLAELWLFHIDIMQSPLKILAERAGLISPQ